MSPSRPPRRLGPNNPFAPDALLERSPPNSRQQNGASVVRRDDLLRPDTANSWRPGTASSLRPGTSQSRRSSWGSDRRLVRSPNPFDSRSPSPYADSRSNSRLSHNSDEDDAAINSQTIAEKYNINPSTAGLLLFPEDVEKDDYLHNPDMSDPDRGCEIFSTRGIINMGGLLFLTLGVLFLFIGYPVITYIRDMVVPKDPCAGFSNCVRSGDNSLLKNIRTGLIDPATPQSAMTKTMADGKEYNLVFSDEFSRPGRTFYPGDDPFWEAVDIWYGATEDIEWYDPDAATTHDGYLDIQFDAFASHNLQYRSAMLQSWNKMCVQGGYIEASMSLPGPGGLSGFWPGFWTMGNLGRPGYLATTDGMWPYSYHDECDAGITANQSSTDGISGLPGMRLPACTCRNEDHPTPGRSRSAPEIDALEGSSGFLGPGNAGPIGVVSQSAQIAPFDVFYQPDYDFVELYDPTITTMNPYRGGIFQQAFSAVSTLNNDWYDGNKYQSFAFDYRPGGADGSITWYIGDEKTWKLTGDSIGPNGNVGQRMVTSEPMALVMNFGMSPTFAPIDYAEIAKHLPAHMRIDYVRIYQDPAKTMVTCDPPGYETTNYIKKHPEPYANANITRWSNTGYSQPKNSYVNNCK